MSGNGKHFNTQNQGILCWCEELYSDDEVARMMVMDGCFILEFCFKHAERNLYLPNKMQNSRIAMDLMLLENQVPFFVLQALLDCTMGKASFTLNNILDKHLAPYIKLFRSLLPEEISTTDVDSDSTHDHVLGYLHKRYQLELYCLRAIVPNKGYYFTSYAHAMGMLINTQEDISKLVESGVLVNSLGTSQEAADMINNICNISITDFYYTKEFKQIDKYYNELWPNNIARLRRVVHFSNLWNFMALIGAIILFSLTWAFEFEKAHEKPMILGMPSQSAESSISDFVRTTLQGRRRFRNVNPEATYVEAGEKNDKSDIPASSEKR
uniref:Putative UPF0481 protein At3g02645 n=1 Tax=Tanacetum cinerariifolium TaxID=118510 RepID=A0A699I3G8_TANCI|nr:putative UPF0481 protein At3g02645 [Tanacetum cinerariifolium]